MDLKNTLDILELVVLFPLLLLKDMKGCNLFQLDIFWCGDTFSFVLFNKYSLKWQLSKLLVEDIVALKSPPKAAFMGGKALLKWYIAALLGGKALLTWYI